MKILILGSSGRTGATHQQTPTKKDSIPKNIFSSFGTMTEVSSINDQDECDFEQEQRVTRCVSLE